MFTWGLGPLWRCVVVHLRMDLSTAFAIHCKTWWLIDEWGYTKWLPGTAGDWAQGRRGPPVLQLVLCDTSGPSERGVPDQHQYAGSRSIRMSVYQTVCSVWRMGRSGHSFRNRLSCRRAALAGRSSPHINGTITYSFSLERRLCDRGELLDSRYMKFHVTATSFSLYF